MPRAGLTGVRRAVTRNPGESGNVKVIRIVNSSRHCGLAIELTVRFAARLCQRNILAADADTQQPGGSGFEVVSIMAA